MNNAKYKSTADAHRRYKRFEIENFVMIRLCPERFPPGTFRKLQASGMGSFEVLSKVGENGYVIDIPNDWGIHPTFNIEDLVAYKGFIALPSSPLLRATTPYLSPLPIHTQNPPLEIIALTRLRVFLMTR